MLSLFKQQNLLWCWFHSTIVKEVALLSAIHNHFCERDICVPIPSIRFSLSLALDVIRI